MKKCVFVFSGKISKTILLSTILASVCVKGCTIYLYGNMGVGKSIFCKWFLYKLGYAENLRSPTYTLVESYLINDWNVHHFDFYRLNSSEEIENIGFRDYFDSDSICLVEWPKKSMQILPLEDISVIMKYEKNVHYRQIIIKFISDLGKNMLESVLLDWELFK